MFLGTSPLRISFAGGGTDMPEYYESYGGCVVTTAITRFVYVFINQSHDNTFQTFSSDFKSHHRSESYELLEPKYGSEIATSVIKYLHYQKGLNVLICSDAPPGSGLGASGSLAVNLVKSISTLQGKKLSLEEIAQKSYDIGRNVLNWPIGKQDEYATTYGGLNFIQFDKSKTTVESIQISKSSLDELQKNLLLFFVGKTRNSATILSTQIQQTATKTTKTISALHSVKELAQNTFESLKNNDLTHFGELLHKGWLAKKQFASGVSNEFIDKIYDVSLKSGALGGKLTGAGGGGHLILYCDESNQQKVQSELEKHGLSRVKFSFENKGPKLINLYDFAKT